jgi:hypothetical protein
MSLKEIMKEARIELMRCRAELDGYKSSIELYRKTANRLRKENGEHFALFLETEVIPSYEKKVDNLQKIIDAADVTIRDLSAQIALLDVNQG